MGGDDRHSARWTEVHSQRGTTRRRVVPDRLSQRSHSAGKLDSLRTVSARNVQETRRGAVRDHVALAGPPSLRALPSAHDP